MSFIAYQTIKLGYILILAILKTVKFIVAAAAFIIIEYPVATVVFLVAVGLVIFISRFAEFLSYRK